jgi:hypothetical protein
MRLSDILAAAAAAAAAALEVMGSSCPRVRGSDRVTGEARHRRSVGSCFKLGSSSSSRQRQVPKDKVQT